MSTFSSQSKSIRSIVHNHVLPASADTCVKVHTYFRPYKMSSKFSTRSKVADPDRSGVVYRFDCSSPGCNAGYIGHTTQTLRNRVKQHRYSSSNVCKHLKNDHNCNDIMPVDELISHFSILYSSNESIKIKTAEALLIKSNRPYINVKYDNSYNLLNLF